MWRRSRTIPLRLAQGRTYTLCVCRGMVVDGNVCESSKVALRPWKAAIKMMDHESHEAKRCNQHQHPSNIHHHEQGWGGWREGGLVGDAMVRCMHGAPYLPIWGGCPVIAETLSVSVLFRQSRSGWHAGLQPNQGATCSLVKRVHRGVAGSTERRKLLYPSEYFSGGA